MSSDYKFGKLIKECTDVRVVEMYKTKQDYIFLLQDPMVFVDVENSVDDIYINMKTQNGLTLHSCGGSCPRLNKAWSYIEGCTRLETHVHSPIGKYNAVIVQGIGVMIIHKDKSFFVEEQAALRRFCRILEFEVNSKARVIQRAFRRAISDPDYEMCRIRLLNEFRGLSSDPYHVDVSRRGGD